VELEGMTLALGNVGSEMWSMQVEEERVDISKSCDECDENFCGIEF